MASFTVTQFVDICNRGEIGSLGWKPLDEINGGSCFTWDDVCAKMHHDGMNHILDDTWFRQPIVVRNQQLFKVPAEVLIELSQCKNRRQMNKFFQDHQFNGESRETTKIRPPKMFSKSIASSLDMTGLCDYVVPLHLKQVHSSAIIGVGRWFTDGHVEEGGDVSVSVTLLGKKFFMIASRGAASERLFNMTCTLNSFISWVMGGPKVECEKNVFFHMTETSDMIIQPALCAHSVLTISTGPFLVSGWEGSDQKDANLKSQLINKYCPGVCNEVLRKGLEVLGPRKAEKALVTKRNTKTEALGQLRSLAERDFLKKGKSNRGRPSLSKKQRRLNNLKDVRESFEARQQQRKDYVAYRLLSPQQKEVGTMPGENESRLSGEDKDIIKEKD